MPPLPSPRAPAALLLCLPLFLAACGEDGASKGADGAGDDAADPTTPPEFYADVAPMLAENCLRCHTEGGQGPGDFSDPAVVDALAEVMLAAIDDGRMPPPVADPSCRDYIGSEHLTLKPGARDAFAAWVNSARLVGAAPDSPMQAPVAPELTGADMELLIPSAYTPVYADTVNPGNEYRCFVLDTGHTEDFFITAMHPLVDAAEILHHSVLFSMPKDELDARWLDPQGVDCINDFGNVDGMISAWAPGMLPIEFEDGAGIRVQGDRVLVLQLHYYASATGVTDRSGYAMRTAPSVTRELRMAPFGAYGFRIPAGEPNYSHLETISWGDGYPPIRVWGSFPHMHVLGTGYRMWVEREDGTEDCLLEGNERYDFHNQLTYMFNEAPVVRPGDRVHFECTWDNSAENPNQLFDPPQDIGYGERTDQEMCYAFTLVSVGEF
ncbi:MAG: hypothetical protein RL071_1130 [Pseudomonadota bacterium]|jgi:hypothetical protein